MFYVAQAVKQVDVPSFSGSFGILPNHVPTLAVLKPGVVSVTEDSGTIKKIFVSSGSVTINDDSSVQVIQSKASIFFFYIVLFQIVAEEAAPVENIDPSAAREILSKAQSQLSSASTEEVRKL